MPILLTQAMAMLHWVSENEKNGLDDLNDKPNKKDIG